MTVEQQHFVQDTLDLNVSWLLPTHLPDNYTLRILDLHKDSKQFEFHVAGNLNSYYVSNITILGSNFMLHLVANSQGGKNTTEFYLNKVPLKKGWFSKGFNRIISSDLLPLLCLIQLAVISN